MIRPLDAADQSPRCLRFDFHLTTDGWKIRWTSPSSPVEVRPQLIVLAEKWPDKPADFNGDTYVDGADFDIFERCASGPGCSSRRRW